MSIIHNSHGQFFRSSRLGGTHPINDSDPQNDDPEFDPEAQEDWEQARADYLLAEREAREYE